MGRDLGLEWSLSSLLYPGHEISTCLGAPERALALRHLIDERLQLTDHAAAEAQDAKDEDRTDDGLERQAGVGEIISSVPTTSAPTTGPHSVPRPPSSVMR